MLGEEVGVRVAGGERRVFGDRDEERHIGGHAEHHIVAQRGEQSLPRRLAVRAPHRDLGQQRIVVDRHLVAGADPRVDADAGRARLAQMHDATGAGQEVLRRILGVDAALDGVAAREHVGLPQPQPLARGDAELRLDQVDAADPLGDRMLDLQARVHLEEVEVARLR